MVVERLADLEEDALRGRVDPFSVPGEGAVLHDPGVAVQIGEVDVHAVVAVEVRRERHREQALLAPGRRHVPRDVEERAGQSRPPWRTRMTPRRSTT